MSGVYVRRRGDSTVHLHGDAYTSNSVVGTSHDYAYYICTEYNGISMNAAFLSC